MEGHGIWDEKELEPGQCGRGVPLLEVVFSWGRLSSRSRLLIQSYGCGGEIVPLCPRAPRTMEA